MPPEVLGIIRKLQEADQKQLAENRANQCFPMRKFWQVTTTPHGSVTEVAYNKLGPDEVNLWCFVPTIDNDGAGVLQVQKHEYVSLHNTAEVDAWHLSDWTDLADDCLARELAWFVGLRDARQVVARLRGER